MEERIIVMVFWKKAVIAISHANLHGMLQLIKTTVNTDSIGNGIESTAVFRKNAACLKAGFAC